MLNHRDLLNSKSEKLEIKMNADGSLFVQRLKQFPVKDLHDVNKVCILLHRFVPRSKLLNSQLKVAD